MICQQELHDAFSGFVCKCRVRLDHHTGLYRPCTGGNRFRRSLNLDQAHTTIPRNHKLLMIAISRYRDAGFLASLNESRSRYTARQFLSKLRYTLAVPSIDTCFPSTVSWTSAGLLDVALKHLAPACHLVCLASRAAHLDSCGRSIVGSSNSSEETTSLQCNGNGKISGEHLRVMIASSTAPPILAPAYHQAHDSPTKRHLQGVNNRSRTVNFTQVFFHIS